MASAGSAIVEHELRDIGDTRRKLLLVAATDLPDFDVKAGHLSQGLTDTQLTRRTAFFPT